jgi:S1-C subfamily serine protease
VKYKMLVRGDGLEVTAVAPASPANAAGLQVGDRIRSIDGEKNTDKMNARIAGWWTDPRAPATPSSSSVTSRNRPSS